MLGALHPGLPCRLPIPCTRLCFIPASPQHRRHGHNPKPPHLAGASGTELTSPPHRFTCWKAPERRCGKSLLEGEGRLEESSGRKPLANSLSLFYREVKCLEHDPWAREWGSPSPRPPTAQGWLDSPLLDETVRVRKAVELVQSLLRTALPFQCRSPSAAATLPPSRQTPRPPPVSRVRHREPPTALATLRSKTSADTRAACALLASISHKVAKISITKSSN